MRWMHRGYEHANAGDLAAVAYNALVALIPTLLLTLSVAGLFFRLDRVFETTIYSSFWGLPDSAAGDTIKTVLTARDPPAGSACSAWPVCLDGDGVRRLPLPEHEPDLECRAAGTCAKNAVDSS